MADYYDDLESGLSDLWGGGNLNSYPLTQPPPQLPPQASPQGQTASMPPPGPPVNPTPAVQAPILSSGNATATPSKPQYGPPMPPSMQYGPPMPPSMQVGATAIPPTPPGPPMPPPPQQGGMRIPAPPQPGPPNPVIGSVPSGTSADFQSAIGIAPSDADKRRSLVAGIGKGLQAGAGTKNSPMAAFMRGAGGGLQGEVQDEDTQLKQRASLQNQYFNQMSNSYKDVIASKAADSQEMLRSAQTNLLTARSGAIANGMTPGARAAWFQSDAGKLHMADTEAAKFREDGMKEISETYPLGDNRRIDAMKQLKIDTAQKLQEAYKKYGVDPTKAEKIRTQGQTYDNPIDASKMDLQTFHSVVPLNNYYKWNGQTYIRNQPPPGAESQNTAPGSQADVYQAMQAQ